MGHTITVRLTPELATWLKDASVKTGVAQGDIIREQLERAKAGSDVRSFMRLAGAMRGPRNLSSRKGFSPRRRGLQTPAFSWRSPTAPTAITSGPPVSRRA
ncbi:MAG: ribbon-helix-helix domain-containing protein [Acidobacteria bacterium]|nr:ribbon-helix-helix domain-containing protein [Acidobacteriota bacterium]